MKLIIAGGRDFSDYALLESQVSNLIGKATDVEIVSGGAKGADRLGEFFAIDYNLPVKRFPVDWDKYGKSAGFRRNAEMADYADHCICFWDGQSRGTKHIIDLAKSKGLNLTIVKY